VHFCAVLIQLNTLADNMNGTLSLCHRTITILTSRAIRWSGVD